MIPPLDPFAQKFDSIEIDPTRAPSPAAIESAMAHFAPAEAPGFYLLDDAGGRFVVDREMGVVSLAEDALLESERGSVHTARLRVIEPSGASYELEMRLRITGRVPQMVGAEEFAGIAGLTDDTVLVAARVPVLAMAIETIAEAPPPQVAWTRFSAAEAHVAHQPRLQSHRGFILADPPATNETFSLEFAGLPAPLDAHLPWSL